MVITLTKSEQILGLRMLCNSIFKKDQKTYKSHAFYSTICKLKKMGLVESNKKGRICEYKLSDNGRILFSLIATFNGNEEFQDFKITGTKIISFS